MDLVTADEHVTVSEAATVVWLMQGKLAEPAFAASPLAVKWKWDDISIPF